MPRHEKLLLLELLILASMFIDHVNSCSLDENGVPLHHKKSMTLDSFQIYLRNFFSEYAAKEAHYLDGRFRKWRLNAYTNRQKSESRFMKRFKIKFGGPEETNVFLGDWSTRYTPKGQVYHDATYSQNPSKTSGFRRMFRLHGYQPWLVWERNTSKLCSVCHKVLEKGFLRRPNPKPWRNEMIKVHGLLRCQSDKCMQACGGRPRYWNRDTNAARNIRWIVEHTLVYEMRPPEF